MLRIFWGKSHHLPACSMFSIHCASVAASLSSIHHPLTPSRTTIFWLVRVGVEGIGRLAPGLLHEHAQRVITQRIAESLSPIRIQLFKPAIAEREEESEDFNGTGHAHAFFFAASAFVALPKLQPIQFTTV